MNTSAQPETTPYLEAMSERRCRDRHRDGLGGRRKVMVDGRFGHMKHNLGWRRFMRRFMRRGLRACRSEFRLLCSAFNHAKLPRRLNEKNLVLGQ